MVRAHISTNASYNFLHFSQQYTVYIMARREKNRVGFSHVRVYGLCQTNFPPVIYAYIQLRRRCANKQDRRDGSNWLWAYLTYGRCKLGSNRHRWRDMVMIQSAHIACASYIMQTNSKPTIAHYFIMEKCVNVYKSSM